MLKLRSFIQCKYAVPASRNVSIGVVPSIGSPTRNDFEVNPRFVNRNPRNLEQMLLARKPVGWEWDRPSRTYWYRLEIQLAKRNVFGQYRPLHNTKM